MPSLVLTTRGEPTEGAERLGQKPPAQDVVFVPPLASPPAASHSGDGGLSEVRPGGHQVTLGHSQAQVTEIYAERDLAFAVRVAVEIGSEV